MALDRNRTESGRPYKIPVAKSPDSMENKQENPLPTNSEAPPPPGPEALRQMDVIRRGTVDLLPEDDEILEKGRKGPGLLEIPLDQFTPYGGPREKAQGPHQITHGDIARACGYCDSIAYYQEPAERWMKTYEDRAFRWLIGTHGTPLDIPNVCQIRHIVKGRYKKNSWWTRVRMAVRKSQDS